MIPQELTERPQWVAWRTEMRDGKPTKVPYQPTSEQRASSTDPSTWVSFEQATLAAPRFDGVGYMFSPDDPYVGLDFDACRVGDDLHPSVWDVIQRLNSYTEVSPSEHGVHVFVKGRLNGHGNRTGKTPWNGSFEVYDRERYFTVTGRTLAGMPDTIQERQEHLNDVLDQLLPEPDPVPQSARRRAPSEPLDLGDEALLEKARSAKDGAEFEALFYRGDTSRHGGDDSAADLALCRRLAFWTGPDPDRIDRLFRASALVRQKWERADYRDRTINTALAGMTEFYEPRLHAVVQTPQQPTAGNQNDEEPKPDPARFFDADHGLVVQVLGREIQRAGHLRVGHDERLYRFSGGVYLPDGDRFAKQKCRVLLDNRFKKRHTDEVLAWLRAHPITIPEQPSPDTINCRNGLLCWQRGELRPHTHEVPSIVQVPVAWKPGAECPRINRFLEEVLPADAIWFIHELIGYALYPGNPMRKAILLHGYGRNGKSVLLNLIRALAGAKNCSAVSLQALGENRFAAAEMFGKLANIAGDLDARAIKRSDTFKMLTGGDSITAERKFCQPFEFTPFALPLFSANEFPFSADQTDAWFDRWIVIPFERRFTEAQADPRLLQKLTTAEELSGLLELAVTGLMRLMDRGRFDIPESVKNTGDNYRSKLDTVRAFVEEECELSRDAEVNRSVLYQTYSRWCKEGGKYPVKDSNFYDSLTRNYPGQIESGKRHGTRMMRGLRLIRSHSG